jgi:hypothetical protein
MRGELLLAEGEPARTGKVADVVRHGAERERGKEGERGPKGGAHVGGTGTGIGVDGRGTATRALCAGAPYVHRGMPFGAGGPASVQDLPEWRRKPRGRLREKRRAAEHAGGSADERDDVRRVHGKKEDDCGPQAEEVVPARRGWQITEGARTASADEVVREHDEVIDQRHVCPGPGRDERMTAHKVVLGDGPSQRAPRFADVLVTIA